VQIGDAREQVDDLLRHPFGEVVVLALPAPILEREDGDRRRRIGGFRRARDGERAGERRHRLEAVLWIVRRCPAYRLFDVRRYRPGAEGSDRLVRPVTAPGVAARQHLGEHAGEAVLIGTAVDHRCGGDLLGAHVAAGADRGTGLRQSMDFRRAVALGDPEIGKERAPFVEQNVFRLHVAMDDAAPVRVVQRVRQLRDQAHGALGGERRPRPQPAPERSPGDERHDVEELPIGLAAVEEGEDRRVLQPCRRADLAEETLAADPLGHLRLQELDRNVPAVLDVLRQVDGGHAARPNRAHQPIPVGERGGERLGNGHGSVNPTAT
jgi:hypothetical protein